MIMRWIIGPVGKPAVAASAPAGSPGHGAAPPDPATMIWGHAGPPERGQRVRLPDGRVVRVLGLSTVGVTWQEEGKAATRLDSLQQWKDRTWSGKALHPRAK